MIGIGWQMIAVSIIAAFLWALWWFWAPEVFWFALGLSVAVLAAVVRWLIYKWDRWRG